MSNSKFFPENFWDYPWTKFFEEYDQEAFDKVCPPEMDLQIDDKGNFITMDGIPGIRMRLAKMLRRPDGNFVYFLLKSQYVESVLKKHDLRSWLQDALEMVHFEHVAKKDSGTKNVTVPTILLAALIQRVQKTELVMKQFGKEIGKVREAMDEHTVPGIRTGKSGRKVLHVDLKAAEQKVVREALEKARCDGHIEILETKCEKPDWSKLGVNTGRFSSEHPNLSNPPGYELVSTETGRVTSDKSNIEEIDKDDGNE